MPHRSVSRRILIADDAQMDVIIAQTLLASEGYDVDTVADAAEAILAVVERPYDLVLVKASMTGLDDVAAAARGADDGRGRPRAVIATTSKASVGAQVLGVADLFIERPLPATLFLSRIGSAVASRFAASGPVIWNEDTYRSLARRLGFDRTRAQLGRIVDRFDAFGTLVANPSTADDEIVRFAHDAQGIGGMLGFEEIADVCRRSQSAFHEKTGPARCVDLAAVIARARLAALEAYGSIEDVAHSA